MAGDTAAYNVLVGRYKNRVFTLTYNIILNREDAEEVAQDAFVKAFAGLRSFKNQAAFSTWLYRIVVNTALNKKKLRKFVLADIEEQTIHEEGQEIYPLLKSCEKEDRKKFIQLAMRALREEERICITLFYLNEFSVAEMEELTGITRSNIKVLLHRGRKHLYEQLNALLKSQTKDLL